MLREAEEQRLERFFAWYRRRVDGLEALGKEDALALLAGGATWNTERQLLGWTLLDSLANYWESTFYGANHFGKHCPRFVAFLVENVPSVPIFDRVMGPFLRRKYRNSGQPEHERAIARACGSHELAGAVRFATQDPPIDDFLKHPEIVRLAISRKEVQAWTWGAFLYSQCRCHWVHRFDRSRLTMTLGLADAHGVPCYGNMISLDDPDGEDSHPVDLPDAFLVRTCREALASFEGRCLREAKVPRHDDEDVAW